MPELIKWANITAAGDVTTTALVEKNDSSTRAAILGLSNLTVGASEAFTDLNFDPGNSAFLRVLASAENRPEGVTGGTGLFLRSGGDYATQVFAGLGQGSPIFVRAKRSGAWDPWRELVTLDAGDPYAFRVRDQVGKVALSVGSDGRTVAPDFESHRASIAGALYAESQDAGYTIKDSAGKVAFKVSPSGRTLIGDLDPASNIGGGGGTGAVVSRVVILWVVGQSNAEGRGLPVSPLLDPVHPRIFMANWSGTTVTGIGPATVPLSSQNLQIGMSPASVIARDMVNEDEGTAVVIINAARGGSGLVFDTTNGVWAVDYAGANTHLLPIAKAALTSTLSEVSARFPGLPVNVQIMWHQGESDGTTSFATYSAAYDALIADLRSHAGNSAAPVVAGGIVPERATAADAAGSMAAQMGAQSRLQHVGFAQGVRNGGGSQAVDDITHYSRQGIVELGHRMYRALRRAYINQTTSTPVPPLTVSATWSKADGDLVIDWEFPMCRATNFTVQYQVDGGTWTTITGRSVPLLPSATETGLTTGDSIRVRVATTNEVGTSAYSTPVYAIGA